MQLINPSVTAINEPRALNRIEQAGRTCYKSLDKCTDDSAVDFVRKIIERGHESVLEHSNLIVESQTPEAIWQLESIVQSYEQRSGLPSYIRHNSGNEEYLVMDQMVFGDKYFSGNARAWRNICKMFKGEHVLANLFRDNVLFEDIEFSGSGFDGCDGFALAKLVESAPGDDHRIVTARIVCDRGILQELARHRSQSFSVESTRYVRYGADMQFIEPWWFTDDQGQFRSTTEYELAKKAFFAACESAQNTYTELLELGAKPQLARAVLPNALKTEVVVTGTVHMWKMWLKLRDDKAAHPDMIRIAQMFKEATGIEKE